MEILIVSVIIINLILVSIYVIHSMQNGEEIWLALLFAFLPIIGFGIYFIPKVMMKICKGFVYDRDSLVTRYEVKGVELAPVLQKELNVIPIEDAMAVSSNQEKRALLLEQLKKGVETNYKSILPAGSDSDSESAHYVAAAKMEIYRKKHEKQSQLFNKLEKDPCNVTLLHEYMDGLSEYISSGLLATRESSIYKADYCRCYDFLSQLPDHRINAKDSTSYLTYLISLERYDEAKAFWETCPKGYKDESGYRKMLEMYYERAEKEKFYECLHELEETDITLSAEGLKMLRFWIARRS